MTEYKRIFANAFDAIKPQSSDAEFVSGVLERTRTMKAQEDGTKIYGARIYDAPKAEKHSRVFGVTAAIAGTAAVLTGAVFGLKWLNDNGGLKGPDVGGPGAGYHDVGTPETTTDALLYSEPDVLVTTTVIEQVTDYYTSDTTFGLGDYNVNVTGYEFNTVFLRLYYTVTRSDGGALTVAEAFGSVSWNGMDGAFTVINHTPTVGDDTSASFVVDIIPDEPTHSLEIPIISGEGAICGTYVARCDNSNYVFRLPCDVEGVDPHISEVFISQSEVILKYNYTDDNPDFIVPSVRVYMKGDYQISYADSQFDFDDSVKKVGYQFRGFAEPCDTSNIGKVYIGDVLVYEAPDIQYPAAEVPTGYAVTQMPVADTPEIAEPLDFSSRTVRMEGYRYDGHILAVKLVGEVDVLNGKHLVFRSVSDPRNLIQGLRQEDGGTYIMWALLDVPEGQTDDIQIVEIPPESEGIEVGTTITVEGTASAVPGYIFGADMTDYGMPGVTLESMQLSAYGLELMFSSEKEADMSRLDVGILLGDVMVPITEINSMRVYDEDSGMYYTCVVVTADNMLGFDLSAASRVTVNGFVTNEYDYDVMPMPERNIDMNEMLPVETAVQMNYPD